MTTPGERSHSESAGHHLSWCIPAGDGNECIICEGDDPNRPGHIVFVVRAPYGSGDRRYDHANLAEHARQVVRSVNALPELLRALEEAQAALIEIRACSIAGAEQGYSKPELWSEALFLSHGDVARALKTIDAARAAIQSAKRG